ncbi:hypothetical protein [Plantactinospora sp. GCM10030261]|uniref:hypothetical protein n=1 Tax=Plantactinospora sp. GCM10030261 TaxID=3273420 RepID=UPI003609C1F3
MIIDDQIEPRVRRILGNVVRREEDEFDSSLRALADPESRAKAIELALTICAFALHDTFDGRPSSEDVRSAAETVADMERWATLTPEEVAAFLTAVLDGKPLNEVLDDATAVMSTFIITGSLLAASPKVGENEWWFNYLDRIEAAIEAAPAS